jgi:hypothetical protein
MSCPPTSLTSLVLCRPIIIRSFVFQEDKKKNKKEKVKPIILHKDEQGIVVENPRVPANHFKEIQPKDDLLLKQKRSVSVYIYIHQPYSHLL